MCRSARFARALAIGMLMRNALLFSLYVLQPMRDRLELDSVHIMGWKSSCLL
jgi:hypothetical protein